MDKKDDAQQPQSGKNNQADQKPQQKPKAVDPKLSIQLRRVKANDPGLNIRGQKP
jgi:hypothetical protein